MDAVRQAQETIDIGVCSEHNRVFECFCTECYCMICPTCLMFDAHKGHKVCKIEEGAKNIRSRVNQSAKSGLLKFQNTQNMLLDIRHCKLSLEQNMNKIISISQKHFDQLIKTLKARKITFLNEIKAFFDQQFKMIEIEQNQWLNKQDISQGILKLQSSNDDIKLIEEASFVVRGIEKLNEKMKYKEINLIEDIIKSIKIGKSIHDFQELKQSFKNYMQKGSMIQNQLKC